MRLKEKIRSIVRCNSVIISIYVEYMCLVRGKGYVSAVECVEKFRPEESRDKKYVKNTAKDLYASVIKNQISHQEYFLFGFSERTNKKRDEFIGYHKRHQICVSMAGKTLNKFSDKFQTYEIFKPFYGREVIKIETLDDREKFVFFFLKHDEIMVKKISGYKGKGVYKINTAEIEDADELFEELIQSGVCVVEECIVQVDEMAAFHPESVNSIRMVTYVKNKEVINLFALVRMGCGNSVVDNAGSGGIIAAVNMENGVVKSHGCRENGEIHEKHPDTNIELLGYQIPKWNELLNIVKKVAQIIPEQKLVGWDFALTGSGWVIIEANSLPSFTGIQMCTQEGIRPLIEQAFDIRVK